MIPLDYALIEVDSLKNRLYTLHLSYWSDPVSVAYEIPYPK